MAKLNDAARCSLDIWLFSTTSFQHALGGGPRDTGTRGYHSKIGPTWKQVNDLIGQGPVI
jgi:hypothetical protein